MTFKKAIGVIFVIGGLFLGAILTGCGSNSTKIYPTAEAQYRAAMDQYHSNKFQLAADGLQKVIFNFSGSSLVDSAQYYMAMSHFNDGDFYLAANEFEHLANGFPGSPLVDDAVYMAGLCYFKSAPDHYGLDQQELNKAIELLSGFIIDYPQSELVPDAQEAIRQARDRLAHKYYEAGRLYFRGKYYKSAEIYFQNVIDLYTDTDWAARSLYYLAELARKQDNFDKAREMFSNFLVVYPEHELAKEANHKISEIKEEVAKSEESK